MKQELLNYMEKLYPGARIKETSDQFNNSMNLDYKHRKSMNLPVMDTIYEITKLETFTNSDRIIIDSVLREISDLQNIDFDNQISKPIIENVFDRAIMNHFVYNDMFDYHKKDSVSLPQLLLNGLQYWRNKTYEGKNVSFGFIIGNSIENNDYFQVENAYISNHLYKDYFAPLSDGMCSFLKINLSGKIIGVQQFDTFYNDSMLPYRFSSVSNIRSECVIIQTRLGDLLLIKEGEIKYVKKNTQWIQFNTKSLMHKLNSNLYVDNQKLKEAIFQSCLDISFAKTGGVLAVIDQNIIDNNELISSDLLHNEEYNSKKRFLHSLIKNKRFQELSRSIRKELLSIDGSTIIDKKGNILFMGTIVRISGGSLGGGRTAATVELSKHGAAIKMSTDGYIQVYQNGSRDPVLTID